MYGRKKNTTIFHVQNSEAILIVDTCVWNLNHFWTPFALTWTTLWIFLNNQQVLKYFKLDLCIVEICSIMFTILSKNYYWRTENNYCELLIIGRPKFRFISVQFSHAFPFFLAMWLSHPLLKIWVENAQTSFKPDSFVQW